MNILVQRITQTKRSTTGNLFLAGTKYCVTLEPPKDPNPAPDGNGFVCISAGIFDLTIRWSDKFKRQVPHVDDVPDRTAIEQHIGNFPRNTDGCTLIGQDFGTPFVDDYVSHSSMMFTKYMSTLYAYAKLRNPGASESEQIWDVGKIEYRDIQ